MSKALHRALAAQPGWKGAPSLVREAQPLVLALYLNKPQWLSSEDIKLGCLLGVIKKEQSGQLEFKNLMQHAALFALVKCAVEPATDPTENYNLGVRWLHSQVPWGWCAVSRCCCLSHSL